MWNISRGLILVTLLFNIGGIFCPTQHSITAVEGENVMIDCGFLTTVSGRNLMWELEGGRDSEKSLGYFLPGDRFCGTDTTECIIHTNGSITLMNVTLDDDRQNYRCLRGNEDGYDYFSDTTLYVLPKGTNGDAAIDEVIGSIPKSYKLGGKGVIYSYEQPTCEDDRDGALITSCYPPPGLIVDKVYDHVDCSCTDSDGNSNSLSIPVNSHTELKENSGAASIITSVTILILILLIIGLFVGFLWPNYQRYKVKNANAGKFGVFLFGSLGKGITGGSNHPLTECDEEGQQLNSNTEDASQRLNEKEAECDEIAKLNEENQNKDSEISDLRRRLTEKEIECTDKSKEIGKLKMDQQKMRFFFYLFELMQRLTERDTECTGKSKEIDKLKMEQKRVQDTEISDPRQKLTEKETECTDKSKEIDKLKMDQQKMRYFYELFELMQRMTERDTKCTDTSEEMDKLDKMNREGDVMERQTIMEQTEFEAVWNMIPVTLQQQLRKHLLSRDKKEKKKAGGEDKDDAKPKEVTAIDQVKATTEK